MQRLARCSWRALPQQRLLLQSACASVTITLPNPLGAVSQRVDTRRSFSGGQRRIERYESAAERRQSMRWSVHHEVVIKEQPLPKVFERLQQEVQTRGLRANSVRQAVDMVYFHCVQQLDSLSETFRQQLLQYFHEQLFQPNEAKFVLGVTLNEAVFGAVIKLHLAKNETAQAWALGDTLHHVAKAKLHFRTIGSILEHECQQGEFLHAFAKWQEIKAREIEWTKTMEPVLMQMVMSCVEHHHLESQGLDADQSLAQSELFHEQMASLLKDLRLACKEIAEPNVRALRRVFSEAGYKTQILPNDNVMIPVCGGCSKPLVKKDITEVEREQLLLAIESRQIKARVGETAKEFLAPFRHWLLARHEAARAAGKLHYILDGPNIAYINQNFEAGSCRLDQVDAVADLLLAAGHEVSITMPFSYLAEKFVLRIRTKHMKQQRKMGKFTTRQRTPEEKQLIEKWKGRGMIFSCRTDVLSDDLFWLYASVLLGKEGRTITNDQGRDHVFALLNSDHSTPATKTEGKQSGVTPPRISMDLIDRWKELTIVNLEMKHEEVGHARAKAIASAAKEDAVDGVWGPSGAIPIEEIRFLHPLPFSRVPQVTARDHFHFPISNEVPAPAGTNAATSGPANVNKKPKSKWLCVQPMSLDAVQ